MTKKTNEQRSPSPQRQASISEGGLPVDQTQVLNDQQKALELAYELNIKQGEILKLIIQNNARIQEEEREINSYGMAGADPLYGVNLEEDQQEISGLRGDQEIADKISQGVPLSQIIEVDNSDPHLTDHFLANDLAPPPGAQKLLRDQVNYAPDPQVRPQQPIMMPRQTGNTYTNEVGYIQRRYRQLQENIERERIDKFEKSRKNHEEGMKQHNEKMKQHEERKRKFQEEFNGQGQYREGGSAIDDNESELQKIPATQSAQRAITRPVSPSNTIIRPVTPSAQPAQLPNSRETTPETFRLFNPSQNGDYSGRMPGGNR